MLLGVDTQAQNARPTPPRELRVKPSIARSYPEDPTGRRIADSLFARATAADAAKLNEVVEVELVFTEQVTQQQIDEFMALGGEITYVYQTVSYGWTGRIPLRSVRSLPQRMGASMVLVKEPSRVKAHLYNATQTGRARAVWASGFGGNPSGFDGDTNITIAIVDSGVDATHTDLSGRQKYFKDWSGTGYTNGTDYEGHGTHVAGIALGTGAAGGSASGAVYFTQFGDLSSSATNTYAAYYVALPSTTTWRAGAKWTNGTTTALNLYDKFYFNGSYTSFLLQSAVGSSPLSVSTTITGPSSDTVYTAGLIKSNTVSAFVITNMLSSYPASPDSFNRFRGVAPGCNWAAAKVFDDSGNGTTTYIGNAVDDLVTYRTNYNIKVMNMSLGVSGGGIDTSLRQKVNTAVQNGIVVVVSAGNDGGSSNVDDPGRAAYAITVGALNASNYLTAYTSSGFTSPSTTSGQEEDYKPDILAPGGSDYTGNILAPDSNNGDSTAFTDQKSNDYAAYKGTSMSSPFVAGAAALVIDAMQQKGQTWDFNSAAHPKLVKMLLSATATETYGSRENGSYNPTLQRATTDGTGFPASKDKYEGYGVMNVDAAVEAVTLTLTNGVTETNSLGGSFSSRRAWARKVALSAYVPITFSLIVPTNGDFDLYLYSTNAGTYGAPTLLTSSTSASTNTDELITYTPTETQDAILVVKRVTGSGSFSFTASTTSNNAFASAYSLSNSASGYSPGNNSTFTTETGEPSGGGSGKSAWYSWIAPYSGKMAFMTTLGVVKMYTGSSVSALSAVTSQYSNTASNNFVVTAGTTYRVSVDSTGGAYTLAWSYQGISTINFTNGTTISLPALDNTGSPYPVSTNFSGVPGTIVGITTTIGGFTATHFDYPKFLMVGPDTQKIILKGYIGDSVAVTNCTMYFTDSGSNIDNFTSGTGTYRPTDSLSKNSSLTSPAPSRPYSTNLSDFIGADVNGTWALYVDVVGDLGSAGAVTNWIVNVNLAQPPTLTIDTNAITYSETVGATNFTSTASITDSDNWDFSGGSLTVQVTNNAATEDVLFVKHQGTSSGQIGVSGSTVSYGGVNFGYYTGGGNGTTPLIVYFTNSSASYAAVQALITRVAYTNASVSSTNQRTVLFTLNDGIYGTNSVSKLLNVTSANHAPTVANAIGNQSATYGASFSFTFATNVFTDSDAGQSLTYTASSSALTNTGIGFNSATRTFSATTVDATNGGTIAGSYSVAVIATDNGSPAKSATNTFTLTINKATASVTASNASRVYGSTNPVFTGTSSGFLAADSITAGFTTAATTNSDVGTYSITPTFTDAGTRLGNYTVTTNNGTLTISKAPVTVAAVSTSRAYGTTNPTFSVTYSGLTNGQTFASSGITGSPSLTTGATTNSAPGAYVITNTVGTLSSVNYSFTVSNGTLTVTQAVVTVSAANATRGYGATNPVFTVNYAGFVNGQTLANSGVTGSPTLTCSATTNSAPGSYVITNALGTLTSANYSFALSNGTLTVTQALLFVTANSTSRGYGATNPTFAVSYSGFTNGQTLASSGVSGAPALSTSATTNSNVGTYVITNAAGTLSSANYAFVLSNGTLTVTQAVLTVTANAASRSYGTTNPAFTVTYTGFTNGQTLGTSGVTGSSVLTTAAATTSPVGSYVITNAVGSLTAVNYSFALVNGTLTVSQAALTVTANNATRSYGVTNPLFSGAITGLLAGDNITASYTSAATTNSAPGAYAISPILTDPASRLSNYTVTTNGGTLTISKADLLVRASDASRVYGGANPIFTASYSGFVNGETSSTLSGAPALSTAAGTTSAIGTYAIAAALGSLASANYAFSFSNGTLMVTQALLSVTPDNVSRAYGQANPTLTGAIVGVVNGDNITASYSTAATTNSPIGTYPITATLNDPGARLANYLARTNVGTLTITNANGSNYIASFYVTNSLVQLGLVGTTNVTFTDPSSGNSIVVALNMAAYSASNANATFTPLDYWGANGTPVHMGVESGLGGGDGNHVAGFEGANFTATLVSASSGIASNSIRFAIAGIGIRGEGGRLTWQSSAGSATFPGNEEALFLTDTGLASIEGVTYSAQVRTTNDQLYQFSDVVSGASSGLVLRATYLVGAKTPLLVTADDASRAVGSANPIFTVSYSGFTGGDTLETSDVTGAPTLTCAATTNSAAGTYVISNALGTLTSSKYSFTLVNGTLTITNQVLAPTYGITLTSPTNGSTVLAGDTQVLTAELSGAASNVTSVQFYEGTTLLGSATAAPYTATWTNVYAGKFQLIARANGANGTVSVTNTVTSQVNFRNPVMSGTNLTMTFYGKSNESYVVYSSTNLVDWQNLPIWPHITNGSVTITIPNATAPQQFFRAIVD